jgi:hypothetical protein
VPTLVGAAKREDERGAMTTGAGTRRANSVQIRLPREEGSRSAGARFSSGGGVRGWVSERTGPSR